MEDKWTYFFDESGTQIASDKGLFGMNLFKGMEFTIHGTKSLFEVVDWSYHLGHPDENCGLHVHLRVKSGSE